MFSQLVWRFQGLKSYAYSNFLCWSFSEVYIEGQIDLQDQLLAFSEKSKKRCKYPLVHPSIFFIKFKKLMICSISNFYYIHFAEKCLWEKIKNKLLVSFPYVKSFMVFIELMKTHTYEPNKSFQAAVNFTTHCCQIVRFLACLLLCTIGSFKTKQLLLCIIRVSLQIYVTTFLNKDVL